MSQIVVVDDDYASEVLVEHLGFLGHDVKRFPSAALALERIEEIAKADILILDIIMPPAIAPAGISGGLGAGMTVFARVRSIRKDIPILAYTATSDRDIQSILSKDPHTTFCPKWSTPSLADLGSRVQRMLGIDDSVSPIRPFIVHGHNDEAKLAVKNFLQNSLGLAEPIILHEQASLGRTIIEKFELYSAQANLAFVILTPDDAVAAAGATDDEKRRARQNVIFELGYFMATFGRSSGRVFLLHKGPLELPSDLSGLVYIDITSGIEAAGEQIRRELKSVLAR